MIRRPPRSTPLYSSAASDVYKRQPFTMQRRNFIQKSAAVAALSGIGTAVSAMTDFQDVKPSNSAFFKLRYAPSFGTFNELAGKDPIDQIKFCHDQGFRACLLYTSPSPRDGLL